MHFTSPVTIAQTKIALGTKSSARTKMRLFLSNAFVKFPIEEHFWEMLLFSTAFILLFYWHPTESVVVGRELYYTKLDTIRYCLRLIWSSKKFIRGNMFLFSSCSIEGQILLTILKLFWETHDVLLLHFLLFTVEFSELIIEDPQTVAGLVRPTDCGWTCKTHRLWLDS